jgi:hypothetical protein
MFARDRHYLDNFLPSATRPQARRVADGKSGTLSGMADWRICGLLTRLSPATRWA